MTWKISKDGAGNIINPGDVCVRANRNGKCEYCVFAGTVYGSKSSTGEYGSFITVSGRSTIKFRNVLMAFDSINERRAQIGYKEILRRFYEQGK